MNILILTQPLRWNYGCLLQAYALQQIVNKLGHNATTDIGTEGKHFPFPIKLLYFINGLIKRYLFRDSAYNPFFYFFKKWDHTAKLENIIMKQTHNFITNYISTTNFFHGKPSTIKKRLSNYDGIIVGSDQVWRPQFNGSITRYFLDFTTGMNIKRIAYAASFGTNEWEYNKQQTKKCAHLVQAFDAVSVREKSAINLCKTYLHIKSTHVLDPTMLLTTNDYISLVEKEEETQPTGDLLTYILTESKEKKAILFKIKSQLNLKPFNPMPKNNPPKELNAITNEYLYPSVTLWIKGFMDAKYIVTDSFHGTVFSILFNKPFITIANKEGGIDRLTSLLKTFNLENRLIHSAKELSNELINAPFDFEKVNSIITTERVKSIQFIKRALES